MHSANDTILFIVTIGGRIAMIDMIDPPPRPPMIVYDYQNFWLHGEGTRGDNYHNYSMLHQFIYLIVFIHSTVFNP